MSAIKAYLRDYNRDVPIMKHLLSARRDRLSKEALEFQDASMRRALATFFMQKVEEKLQVRLETKVSAIGIEETIVEGSIVIMTEEELEELVQDVAWNAINEAA